MKATTYKTVCFKLDDDEKAIMQDAVEIMRKVRNKFLTSDMPKHQEQIDELMKLMQDVVLEKEINE